MAFDKELVAAKLRRWEKYLREYRLPEWDRLPDLGLYMEQVTVLMRQYLDYLPPELKEEQFITASTINNYVRMKIMPEPRRKRYYRIHLAYLIVILTLKQSLSITMIRDLLPSDQPEEEMEAFYRMYTARHRIVSEYFVQQVRAAAGSILDHEQPSQTAVENASDLIIAVCHGGRSDPPAGGKAVAAGRTEHVGGGARRRTGARLPGSAGAGGADSRDCRGGGSMQQLMMLRPAAPVTPRPLPAGYAFVPFGGTQAEISDWLTVCAAGLLPNTDAHWFEDSIRNYPDLDPARDLFFVTDAGGARIATSAAVRHADGTGYIHMVGALPACRGKGIGHAMLAHALEELQARACPVVTLTTDDHRLAAIKTYLDAGFRPVLRYDPDSDMRARWDAVIAALGYEPVAYLQEM